MQPPQKKRRPKEFSSLLYSFTLVQRSLVISCTNTRVAVLDWTSTFDLDVTDEAMIWFYIYRPPLRRAMHTNREAISHGLRSTFEDRPSSFRGVEVTQETIPPQADDVDDQYSMFQRHHCKVHCLYRWPYHPVGLQTGDVVLFQLLFRTGSF